MFQKSKFCLKFAEHCFVIQTTLFSHLSFSLQIVHVDETGG